MTLEARIAAWRRKEAEKYSYGHELNNLQDQLESAFLAGMEAAEKPWAEMCEELERALDWYSDGLYPGDESMVGNELRCGKRAREALSKLREFRSGK